MTYEFVDNMLTDEQIDIQPGKVYLVGPPQSKWVAFLICPCGCGEKLGLNMISNAAPRWTADVATQTLTPSVRRMVGCKTHFSIKQGMTIIH